jgi:hypothetical protein
MHRIVSFVASIKNKKNPVSFFFCFVLFFKKISSKIDEVFFFSCKFFPKNWSKRPRAELEIRMCHNDALPEYPSTSITTLLQVERVGLVSQSVKSCRKGTIGSQLPKDCNNSEKGSCLYVCILNAWSTLCMIDSSRAKVVVIPITNEEACLAMMLCRYPWDRGSTAIFRSSSSAAANGYLAHFPFALWSYVFAW